MSTLDQLVAATRERVARRRSEVSLDQLQGQLAERGPDRPFSEALVRPGLSVIAEFKRRSPSGGEIRPDADVGEIAAAYERGGAAAMSVLTEEDSFGGTLADLRAARDATGLPILRKDFTVDEYQVYEAAVGGADAVLLIVAALGPEALATLYETARALDLDCLVEVHDEPDLERALELDCDVIGINNRDLRDLQVNLETTHELLTDVPAGKTVVAESGYQTREQIEELDRIGVDAVLVGESLLRAADPEQAVRELTIQEDSTREHLI